MRDGWLHRLRALLHRFPGAGIGEAGLHFAQVPAQFTRPAAGSCCSGTVPADSVTGTGSGGDREAQLAVCRAQLALAVELGRPVSLHCVGKGSGEALRRLLVEVGPFAAPACVVMHSYSLGPGLVQPLLRAGGNVYFSFSGSVMNLRARKVRDAAVCVPLTRLLIESDAPDQMPTRVRGAVPPALQWMLARTCERAPWARGSVCSLPRAGPSAGGKGASTDDAGRSQGDGTSSAGGPGGHRDSRWCACCDHDRAMRHRAAVNEPGNVAAFVAEVSMLRAAAAVDSDSPGAGLSSVAMAVACAAYHNARGVFDFAA